MKMLAFAKRNFKELIRDALSLIFMIFLPLFVFLLMYFITSQMPQISTFQLDNFTPATVIFSFSFLSLFSSTLVARDRASSFLTRLLSSPLNAKDYILGYMLPLFALAIIQIVTIFLAGIVLGLTISWNLLFSILCLTPISVLFISLGLLIGSAFTEKQSLLFTNLLVQLTSFTSGMWFNLNMIGGAYKVVSYILPFAHCVDLVKGILNGSYEGLWINALVIGLYTILFTILAIILFKRSMKKQ